MPSINIRIQGKILYAMWIHQGVPPGVSHQECTRIAYAG